MTTDKQNGLPGLMLFLCEHTMKTGRGLEGLFIGDFVNKYRTGVRYLLSYES